jgi:hypothetical protein
MITSVMGQAEKGTKDEQILEHGLIFMGRIDRGGEYKAGRGNEPERGVGCPPAAASSRWLSRHFSNNKVSCPH